MTVPDGTLLTANQIFNKIWRVYNSGSCTWGDGFALVFVGGESMGAPLAISVPRTTSAGVSDLLLTMIAPINPGLHTGYWRMRSPSGQYFGSTF